MKSSLGQLIVGVHSTETFSDLFIYQISLQIISKWTELNPRNLDYELYNLLINFDQSYF